MCETASLPGFAHIKEEQQVHQNDYVDDILTSLNSLDQLKTNGKPYLPFGKHMANVEQIRGAVFASRLKKHFESHSRIEVKWWYHLVHSQTVLGAVQRDSFGYQMFLLTGLERSRAAQERRIGGGPQKVADQRGQPSRPG